ncbi:STAS/SEC14 domain-containing protein [Marinoscillum sp.]|uniref:STAS/SEC14 domain-containing protein n=1 Tax=Marinoscillum sp. TaxID=2024838 RepID=UPI003BACEAF9
MAGHSIITYKGKEILYVDYQGMKEGEILEEMDKATDFALKEGRPMLRLSNMTNVFAVSSVVEKAKQSGKRTKHLTIKRAAVGITGAKRVLFNAFNRFTGNNARAFDDLEEAKEWLVS